MAADAVCVAVLKLFFRRIANVDDFDIEIQILTGKWVIPVDRDMRLSHTSDRDDLGVALA